MKNPIPSSGLWHTPASLTELHDMINQFTGQEASLAAHVMMLTLNTCHKLVDDELKTSYNTLTNTNTQGA